MQFNYTVHVWVTVGFPTKPHHEYSDAEIGNHVQPLMGSLDISCTPLCILMSLHSILDVFKSLCHLIRLLVIRVSVICLNCREKGNNAYVAQLLLLLRQSPLLHTIQRVSICVA